MPIRQIIQRYEFACTLARKVGLHAAKHWEQNGGRALEANTKGLQDFVTEADKQAEETIRSELAKAFPEDGFIGEETGGNAGKNGYWVVDPIDGTANYMRGLRHWGVSIAYVEGDKTIIGVIHDSPTDRIYAAILGNGATRDGVAIQVSTTDDPHWSTGILGYSRRTAIEGYLSRLRALYEGGIEYRRIGSAAIGIVRVAEGVTDFYYETHLNCWDALAALLIAHEAGAKISAPDLDEFIPNGGEVFCCTPGLGGLVGKILID